MDHCRRRKVLAPLPYFILINFLLLLLLIIQSDGRYLRPSDHGLAYQYASSHPTKRNATEMLSFFKGGKTVSLPEAKNLTVGGAASDWWKNRERRMSREANKNHARKVLLITSLVCGLSGVVLLVVSALLFLIRYKKQQRQRQPQLGVELSKHKTLSIQASTSAVAGGVAENQNK